ncbi:MAG TPA: TRAP transporter large permease [Chloroflexota bacterium]|nr:TRAP transporter large permease [Chloroflexota bacterium]
MLEWYWSGLIMVTLMLGLMFIGMPAGLAMGLTSVIMITAFLGPNNLLVLANVALDRGSDNQFLVAPLFIFMAAFVAYSGVAEDAYIAVARWLNRLPGSLALASTGACAAFAGVSGSSVADALTVGTFAIPQMIKHGYNARLAVSSVATAGTLGILIPPSISMVIFGIITETSIGQLFIAGIIPGILLALVLMGYIVIVCALNPKLAPPAGAFSWRERFEALRPLWAITLLFVLVMGSMYFGIATTTEAAAVGAGGAFLLMLLRRRFTWQRFVDSLGRAAETTSMVALLLLGGFSLSYVAAALGIAHGLAEAILDTGLSPVAVIILYNVLLLVLGAPLETSTIIVITMPLLFPAFVRLGFDPLWLGVLTTINSEIGTVSPPSGLVLFAMKGIAPKDYTTRDLFLGVLPFNLVLLGFLIVVIAFPPLATWLPSQMAK